MAVKDGRQRSPEGKRCEGSQFKSEPRSLGAFSSTGGESRSHPLTVTREDCNESNTVVTREWSISGIPGKIVGQLISETEKQLAYYEEQSKALRERLEELKQIPQGLEDINHNE